MTSEEVSTGIRNQILLKLALQVLDSVPLELSRAAYASAIPRYFDADVLSVALLSPQDESKQLYSQICPLPFVQQYDESHHTIFDAIRVGILERWRNSNLNEYRLINN